MLVAVAKPYRTGTRRVTLETVAKDARVSVSTVSKVLNGRSGVSMATRRAVEERLEKHGYSPRNTPNIAKTIEVVFFELDTEWILEVLQGVDKVARELGCSILLTRSHDLHSPERGWADGVVQRRPLGVILLFSSVSAADKRQLRNRSIPFVVVDPAGKPDPDIAYVGAQNWAGGLAATEHLISLGHREIAMINGPEDQLCSQARMSGFRAAMEMAGLSCRPEFLRWGDFHPEEGRSIAAELLQLPTRPTALFAGADLQALGVYQAAGELGLRIPEDLSVVGFDDLPIAALAWPPLTTVRQPIRDMAETAARVITEPPDPQRQRLELATELVIRASTSPCGASSTQSAPTKT
jgi:LacI family xylobiose transport system transcriptional regulator